MKKHCGLILILAVLSLALSGCGASQTSTQATQEPTTEATAEAAESTQSAAQSSGLVISLDALSETPTMFDWTQDGVQMQVIALKDEDGTPHLAYNTCQVCAGSPYAYFEYVSGYLVCQNCGNAFPLSSVGRVGGGCNPMPTAEYETQDGSIILSEETLANASSSFVNWKAF